MNLRFHRHGIRSIGRFLLASCLGLGIAGPARADLINGGFEDGVLGIGWTEFGDAFNNSVSCPFVTAFEGNCNAFFDPVGSTGGIFQAWRRRSRR
jgi:hypothetical protein